MRVGSIVSEKLAVSFLHPERGGNMHFRNIGRPRNLQHELSVVKAAAYDFTQFVRTKKRAAPQIRQFDCSCTHNNHCGLQQPAGHKHTEPTITCSNGLWLTFWITRSWNPQILSWHMHVQSNKINWTARPWRESTTNPRNTRSYSLNNTASHSARLEYALYSYIA